MRKTSSRTNIFRDGIEGAAMSGPPMLLPKQAETMAGKCCFGEDYRN